MEFVIGYNLKQFLEYYRSLQDLYDFYLTLGSNPSYPFEMGNDELEHVKRNPDHLIVWLENNEIVGHCIWHETTTDEMIAGDPRDDTDREALHHLFNGTRENIVELHEVWLKTEHRHRGLGTQFFDFFENYASKKGFEGIVYYTNNPSALALCRKRGYREALEPLEGEGMYVLALTLSTMK